MIYRVAFAGRKRLAVAAVLSCVLLLSGATGARAADPQGIGRFGDYVVQAPLKTAIVPEAPTLPDISGITANAAREKADAIATGTGKAAVVPMSSVPGLGKFLEKDGAKLYGAMQGKGTSPQAILVSAGAITLQDVATAVKSDGLRQLEDGSWLLSRPIYVAPKATLLIRGEEGSPLVLHMSSVQGGAIVSAGNLYVIDTQVVGWDETKGQQALFKDKEQFRPFLAFWNGSDTYLAASQFLSLGYHGSKAYGISFSTDKNIKKADPKAIPPKGWLVESRFEDMYYGFYSYEAEDVAIVGCVYANNIIYGIDPHDRSKRLIIARNEAFGSKKKHGIIVSREVNDSWIFENNSHHNHGAGIMLDRTSVRNIVASNHVHENEADGIVLFESQDNFLWQNTVENNRKSGLRVRNSWNVRAVGDVLLNNKGVAVQVYAIDITTGEEQEHRDFVLDPFTQRASLEMYKTKLEGNNGGGIKINGAERVLVSEVDRSTNKNFFAGAFDTYRKELDLFLSGVGSDIEIVLPGKRGK